MQMDCVTQGGFQQGTVELEFLPMSQKLYCNQT